jgi:hypothetical protein
MSDAQEIQILTEIKEQIKATNQVMNDIKNTLQQDRSMMWKVLALTIVGAFAIIGVKIAFP